jgi:FAD synthetase
MSGADDGNDGAEDPTRAVAQGTFDLIHPGHVHYLREAADYADELHVIVARSSNVSHKEDPVLPARQRRDVVGAIDAVDEAHLGHESDIFVPIERIGPDTIVLGYDQHHDEDAVQAALDDRGIDCDVARAGPREPRYDDELLSTGRIVERILERRG